MIKWLASAIIIAATASGANSCNTKTNPNNVNQFNGPPGAYNCELDISRAQNFHGYVAYYVRNYCGSPDDVPQVQAMTLWVESRPGIFDDWTQLGTARSLNGRPAFPAGQSKLIVGGACVPGTEVRLAWHVLGSTADGKDFGPLDKVEPGEPAPC